MATVRGVYRVRLSVMRPLSCLKLACATDLSGLERKVAYVQTEIHLKSVNSKCASFGFRFIGQLLVGAALLRSPMVAQSQTSGNMGLDAGEASIENLLHQMTLEEKVHMLFEPTDADDEAFSFVGDHAPTHHFFEVG